MNDPKTYAETKTKLMKPIPTINYHKYRIAVNLRKGSFVNEPYKCKLRLRTEPLRFYLREDDILPYDDGTYAAP